MSKAIGKFVRRMSNASIDLHHHHRRPQRSSLREHGHKRSHSDTGNSFPREAPGYHVVHYMGYAHIEDPKSFREAQAAIKHVLASNPAHRLIKLLHPDGTMVILDSDGERLFFTELVCVQDVVRGYGDSIAVTFSSGRYAKQCHVFQAHSSREVADVVQSLQKACRGANKSRRISSESSFSLGSNRTSRSSIAGGVAATARQHKMSMSFLEDEEELVEVKPISSFSRVASKRVVNRVHRASVETTPTSTSAPGSMRLSNSTIDSSLAARPPPSKSLSAYSSPKQPRRHRGKKEREFITRQDKLAQLTSAVDRVVANNAALRQICCGTTAPQNPLQDALYAIQTDSVELLHSYLVIGRVAVDETDLAGNSLLHYAVAMGNADAVHVLCDCRASLDHAGWQECRPLHRAVAEGNTPVLQLLLARGSCVNATDFMRRTPLHMTACKLVLNECSIALLEFGAQIMAEDVLGLKPFDIYPELKETQNRLITSACESFASAQLNEHLPTLPTSPSVTSVSSSLTGISSISGDHMRSHDDHMRSHDSAHPLRRVATPMEVDRDADVRELLSEVSTKARVIALRSQAFKRRHRFKKLMRSRSIGHLAELRETEEEEIARVARTEKLIKFPSELHLSAAYVDLEERAGVIVGALNRLIKGGPRVQASEVEEEEVEIPLLRSPRILDDGEDEKNNGVFAESDLLCLSPGLGEGVVGEGRDSVSPRPYSTATLPVLRTIPGRVSRAGEVGRIRWKGRDSFTSQSSAGSTAVKSLGLEDATARRVTSDVVLLEEDLRVPDAESPRSSTASSKARARHSLGSHISSTISRPSSAHHFQDSAHNPAGHASSSIGQHHSQAETEAIFNDIVFKIHSSQDDLENQEPRLRLGPALSGPRDSTEMDGEITNIDDFSGPPLLAGHPGNGGDDFERLLPVSTVTSIDDFQEAPESPNSAVAMETESEVGVASTGPKLRPLKASLSLDSSATTTRKSKRSKRSLFRGLLSPKPRSPTHRSTLPAGPYDQQNLPPAAPPAHKRKMSLPESSLQSAIPSHLLPASELSLPSRGSSSVSLDLIYNQRSRSGTFLSQAFQGDSLSEPVFTALGVLVTLSSNRESLATLVSYICLPKCVSRLTSLARSPHSPPEVLANISSLIRNIFDVGRSDSKKALGSGVLDLTIKLLNSRDPIPGTCLSLLNGLLFSDDDRDFLRTIIRIPSAPLLGYLEPRVSDSDSGYGRRDTGNSGSTFFNSDNQTEDSVSMTASNRPITTVTEETASQPSSGLESFGNGSHVKVAMAMGGLPRVSSLASETSEAGSTQSLMSPNLHGPTVTHVEARHIVLKVLAVSSRHVKMQRDLATLRAVQLLADCLTDPSLEVSTNAAITLANVGQNVESHSLLLQVSLPHRLRPLLSGGPRLRYHSARALVYLKQTDLEGVSLFQATSYDGDGVLMVTSEDGETYVRGATIERCVELLTSNYSQLWGGLSFAMATNKDDYTPPARPSRDQIFTFFVYMFQSFLNPIILMRLLKHRLAESDPHETGNPFDWSVEPDKTSIRPLSGIAAVPPVRFATLKLITHWMEIFPEDFLRHGELGETVVAIVQRMNLVRGPYLPQMHRLRSLLGDLSRPRRDSSVSMEAKTRTPHHNNLQQLYKQMIVGGHLPVTLDEAVFMAGLQMHIEDIAGMTRTKRSFTSRFKAAIPAAHARAKNINKRIRQQVLEFEQLSERNSKHLYIERCQRMPGYNCTFFSVRVATGGRFRRGPVAKQQIGISNRHVVFLDDKTKELLSCYSQREVLGIGTEAEPSSLALSLRGSTVRFTVDSPGVAMEIISFMEQSRESEVLEACVEDDIGQLSASIPSLHAIGQTDDQIADTHSSLSSRSHSIDYETTPTPEKPSDDPKSLNAAEFVTPNGPLRQNSNQTSLGPGGLLSSQFNPHSPHHTHTSSPLHAHTNGHTDEVSSSSGTARSGALVMPKGDELFFEDEVPFCDCPPDPEIPRGLNLQHLTLRSVLRCHVEVARQMSLIAHDHFCAVSTAELLRKVNILPKRPPKPHPPQTNGTVHHLPSLVQPETEIEKLAYRFNQVSNWVAHGILQFEELEERVETMQHFLIIAKHCLEFRNYSTLMAMMAGLGSASIRRLHRTWEAVGKPFDELYKEMDAILESKGSYKNYRHRLSATTTPAVPYIGVFLTDLTYICEGNPDYLRGGLVNVHKRRQVYKKLEEIRHFQQDSYNFHEVPDLQQYLLTHRLSPEDELHTLSHTLEPRLHRSHSHTSTRNTAVTTTPNFSFFRSITRTGSNSASNLHRTH